jgi:hypothetical protein
LNVYHSNNKWYHLWQVIREGKIAAKIVTEAHMDDTRRDTILSLFGRVLHIEYTKDPAKANAKGVAIVLNKNMIKTDNIKATEIVPSRALLLEMENIDGMPVSILGVYAPNAPGENGAIWTVIKDWFIAHPRARRPELMRGDTNVVEDALDRLLAHPDGNAPVAALDELKRDLRLIDGWRETYLTKCAYTYH